MVRHMHLTTHGSIVALSDKRTGFTVLIAPDDEVDQRDWLDACREHKLPTTPAAWDYTEDMGWVAWAVMPNLPLLTSQNEQNLLVPA